MRRCAPPLDETGIRWSVDGATWSLEPFPDDSISGGTLAVGSSSIVLQTFGIDGGSIWVRGFPG